MLHFEPGAYVHNSKYVKRLIYDSIDWLDDNKLNYSAGTTISNMAAALTADGDGTAAADVAAAMEYLLPNGVLNGVAAERP
jgi:hypothetical protein